MNVQYKAGEIYQSLIEKRLDLNSHPIQRDLHRAEIKDNNLCFEKGSDFFEAVKEGIFMLKIPPSVNIKACDSFAQNFYKDSLNHEYQGFNKHTSDVFDDPLLGFHQRIDQIEQFLLERRFWQNWYPSSINRVGEQLCLISKMIIKCILQHTGINQDDFSMATGGCSELNGSYHLTFNHYRPTLQKKGLSSHKDDGLVTILRTVSPGLEINRLDKWERVKINTDYFIINFGLTMEILTRHSALPVAAIMHRVSQQDTDRWSWGHFSSSKCTLNDEDAGIYEFFPNSGLKKLCQSRELINNNDHEIYFGTEMKEK